MRRNNFKQGFIRGLITLLFLFYPRIQEVVTGEVAPNSYLRRCIEPTVEEGVALLSSQGGYANPEGFVLYRGSEIKYLCYQSQYYLPCSIQQPLLSAHFAKELETMINDKTAECMKSLQLEYERRGYDVQRSEPATTVSIIPGIIRLSVNAPMEVTKESTTTFRTFNVEVPSSMYTLLMIATSIVDHEATYGNAEVSTYMLYYPNLKIEKMRTDDDSKIYTITDVVTEESFTFASRSVAWPPGYGLGVS
jgi:hypothetical protein